MGSLQEDHSKSNVKTAVKRETWRNQFGSGYSGKKVVRVKEALEMERRET